MWHKIEGCDCLPKTQQLAKTNSISISCELCPMPLNVKTMMFYKKLSSTDVVVNGGLNYKDLKVAKFLYVDLGN